MTHYRTRPRSWEQRGPQHASPASLGLVKLSDDGKKATYGRISGDDVYIKSGDAFVKV
jgi:hypothetical protein